MSPPWLTSYLLRHTYKRPFSSVLRPRPNSHFLWHQSHLLFQYIIRRIWYERVYLPLYKVADTPFHVQGDEFPSSVWETSHLIHITIILIFVDTIIIISYIAQYRAQWRILFLYLIILIPNNYAVIQYYSYIIMTANIFFDKMITFYYTAITFSDADLNFRDAVWNYTCCNDDLGLAICGVKLLFIASRKHWPYLIHLDEIIVCRKMYKRHLDKYKYINAVLLWVLICVWRTRLCSDVHDLSKMVNLYIFYAIL